MEAFGQAKEEWLKKYLELPHGIPSHDTFSRVISCIKPDEFQECFIELMKHFTNVTDGEIVSIDGKTLRGSHDENTHTSVTHMVSAWANANQLVLGQVKTHEKSNEITAIPQLLKLLELKDTVVTLDAMGCQKSIAKNIVDKEADYILALKDNHKNLCTDTKLFFDSLLNNEFEDFTYQYHQTKEKDHGRIETRTYYLVNDIEWLECRTDWKNLNGIGMVESKRIVDDKESVERRYYITSLNDNVELFAKGVRKHWGIENKVHWVLDVSFNEDKCRIRKDHSAANLAVIRHISMNLLRKEKTFKGGIKTKKLKCGWEVEYLEKVIFTPLRG